MHKKRYTVTGLSVEASYTSEEVTDIFLPLLQKLVTIRAEKGDRVIVYLAAPPGAGKTTLSLFLEDLYREIDTPFTFQAAAMDGFHHYNAYLDSNDIEREGAVYSLRTFKGIPETFDRLRLYQSIRELKRKQEVLWPTYDRLLHDVSDETVKVDADIVLVEGNYLLLDQPRWADLRQLCDYSIFIESDIDTLTDRLVDRKQRGGATHEEARRHYERTDKVNAERVLSQSSKADLTLWLNSDGRLTVKNRNASFYKKQQN